MDPSAVEAALGDRAARVHADLHERWDSVPHSTRRIDAGEYEYPATSDDSFPFAAVGFVVDEPAKSAAGRAADHATNQTTGSIEHAETPVLVCRDAKHDDLVWEPPGGKGHDGENPAETVEREVREETGIEAAVLDLIATELLRFDHGHAVLPVMQGVFIADRTGGCIDPEPGIEPRWFQPNDLPAETQYREHLLDAIRNP